MPAQMQDSKANTPNKASPSARFTRALALFSIFALIILSLAWELWLAPLRPGGSWWALKALFLLPALPGVMRYRLHTYRWLALLTWFYFTEGVVRAYSETGLSAYLAGLEILFSLLLEVACNWHVYHRLKAARKKRKPT